MTPWVVWSYEQIKVSANAHGKRHERALSLDSAIAELRLGWPGHRAVDELSRATPNAGGAPDDGKSRIAELEGEVSRLETALTQYAASINWADGDDEGIRRFWARRDDGRSLARAALRWPITDDEISRTSPTGRADGSNG